MARVELMPNESLGQLYKTGQTSRGRRHNVALQKFQIQYEGQVKL